MQLLSSPYLAIIGTANTQAGSPTPTMVMTSDVYMSYMLSVRTSCANTPQLHYNLPQAGLKVPKGWFNDIQSLAQGCEMDRYVYRTVIALKIKYGYERVLPLLTNLHGTFLLLALRHSGTEQVLYLRNSPWDYVGVITKPQSLAGLVDGLDEVGATALDFDEVEFQNVENQTWL